MDITESTKVKSGIAIRKRRRSFLDDGAKGSKKRGVNDILIACIDGLNAVRSSLNFYNLEDFDLRSVDC